MYKPQKVYYKNIQEYNETVVSNNYWPYVVTESDYIGNEKEIGWLTNFWNVLQLANGQNVFHAM